MCLKIYSGVPRYHWLYVLAAVFYYSLFRHIGLLVVLGWIVEWEASSIHWVPIAFNLIFLVFTYYYSVFVEFDYAFIVTELSNLDEAGLEVGGDFCTFCLA